MEIVKIYEEHISGAKKNEERHVLTECLDYCTGNNVDYLLLSELSRLGRSTLQVLKSLERLHEAKVSVYIQNLGIYSLQPNGEVNPIASILITVLAEMGNIERANIQYRLNSGRAQYVRNGGKLGRKTGKMIKTIKELLIEWWAGNNTTKMPITTIYTYEVEVDGKTITIESMSRSRMYVHYKARRKYPNAKYIRVINQTKTY